MFHIFYAYKENCECEEIACSLLTFYDFSDETHSFCSRLDLIYFVIATLFSAILELFD